MKWVECEACGNDDALAASCVVCHGRGRTISQTCLKKRVPTAAWDLLEMASFADKGTWPVAGGVIDQTALFVRGYRMVRLERVAVEAELVERAKKGKKTGG